MLVPLQAILAMWHAQLAQSSGVDCLTADQTAYWLVQ